MALNLPNRYPGRFNPPSTQYPQGSFKNRTTPTAKDGSYLEKDWANDKEGFFQSLLAEAGVVPNGLVDAVGASQYFTALKSVAVTPDATEAVSGKVELATQAEAEAGTDNVRVPTILRLFQAIRGAAANATDTLRGTLRIATQAEVNAGTLSTVAVSPSRMLAGLSINLAANGYIKFPQMFGGLIIQWGSVDGGSSNAEYNVDITFPITFANACRAVVSTAGDPSYSANEWVAHTWVLSTTQFHLQLNPVANVSQNRKATWIAIGS